MPVPSTVADLSSSASSNYPQGGDSVGASLDDYMRSHAAIIRQVYDGHETDIASLETSVAATLPEIGTYALLRAYTGTNIAYFVRGVTNIFDGGFGVFRVDSADTTSADNGGTILVGSDGRRWKREYSSGVNVKWFGAAGDGVINDTAPTQAAIDYATSAGKEVDALSGPYLISSITLTCKVNGSVRDRFGANCTFKSAVGAGVYAITYSGDDGALEGVTIVNTGAGNGINAESVSTQTAMKDVYVVSSFTLATGSGSIGVSYGSDSTPGTQAITNIFDTVIVRGYDICHRMRYYSNSNTYRKLYALNTTVGTATQSTAGFLVNSRGAVFDSCNCESNFLYALDEKGFPDANPAEENTYLNFWAEGVSGTQISVQGYGSLMLNPYGLVGLVNSSTAMPINRGPYARVVKNRGPSLTVDTFNAGANNNLLRNAEFPIGLGGLTWGSNAVPSGTLLGYNAISIESASSVTSFTTDHVMSYIDLDTYTWLRGKTVTFACIGQANNSGVSLSIRGIVRTSGGSNLQYATSESFSSTTPQIQKISFNIPTDPTTAKTIVFRINASGVTAGTPSIAGKIAMPMVFVGNDLQDITPHHAGDGANTFYGNQTLQGGGWNSAHLVLGSYHLWVDSTGDLRIKSSAPTSDTDGAVVGTQT